MEEAREALREEVGPIHMRLTKDPEKAVHFTMRDSARRAAVRLGWPVQSVLELELRGFRLFTLSNGHGGYVERAWYHGEA